MSENTVRITEQLMQARERTQCDSITSNAGWEATGNFVLDLCDRALYAQLQSDHYLRRSKKARDSGDKKRALMFAERAAHYAHKMRTLDERAYRIESQRMWAVSI